MAACILQSGHKLAIRCRPITREGYLQYSRRNKINETQIVPLREGQCILLCRQTRLQPFIAYLARGEHFFFSPSFSPSRSHFQTLSFSLLFETLDGSRFANGTTFNSSGQVDARQINVNKERLLICLRTYKLCEATSSPTKARSSLGQSCGHPSL